MPLLGATEARRTFRLGDLLPASWEVSSRLRGVARLVGKMPFEKREPTGVVGGPGFLILPHDPCRAIGLIPHVRRLIAAFDGQVALACPSNVLPWLPALPVDEILECQTSSKELDGWCHETVDKRRGWAWSLDEDPDAGTLAALAWLGGERRIAPDIPGYARVANIRLPVTAGMDGSEEAVRNGFATRLGLVLPEYQKPDFHPGSSIVLEIPPALGSREFRMWVDLASALSMQNPLIVVHFDFLPTELGDALRGLGNRLSLLRISRSDDVFRLGRDVRAWVSRIGPAAILASQSGCAPVFLDEDRDPSLHTGYNSVRVGSKARFLGSRNPTPSEVCAAVLDLPASGM